ncbi:MAG: type 1 glutamine amidotransferase domain-containing protein [Gammaproteobacteria bacterium]|jgi:protease I
MSRIAMLVGEGYEDAEFQVPYDRLRDAGHEVVVLGQQRGARVSGKRGESHAEIQHTADEVQPGEFDAVVIPGGHGPDKLRLDAAMVEFTRRFGATGRPLAAICHGPQLLIEADVVNGRTLTSWPSVRKDLINAGAHWVDAEVVTDGNLITSRKPADLDAFCEALLEKL